MNVHTNLDLTVLSTVCGEVQVLPQNKSYILSIKDYSMMVATRPEPTVLPPSRFVGYKILLLLGVFQALFYLYYSKYALLFEVLKFFRTIVEPRMYKLMFIHPLVNLAEKYLMLVPCSQILLIFVYTPPSFQ